MSSGVVWSPGVEVILEGLRELEKKVEEAVAQLAKVFEPILESYAKGNAPWTDRTGNARQSLFSASELAEDVVTLYLSHGMEYGVFLELCHGGRYRIIMPTLEAHYNQIMESLRGIFG